jgi:hypothetical protein
VLFLRDGGARDGGARGGKEEGGEEANDSAHRNYNPQEDDGLFLRLFERTNRSSRCRSVPPVRAIQYRGQYPQGEKRIVIPANAHVVRNAFGSKDDLSAHDTCATDAWCRGRRNNGWESLRRPPVVQSSAQSPLPW